MKFIKAFTSKKDISKFKKDFSEMEISTEVISNLIHYESKSEEAKNLMQFLFSEHNSSIIMYAVNSIAETALTETFGKYDFTFEGNRTYKNWILKFNEHLFIVPAKREVVIPDKINIKLINNAIMFEKEFINFCVNFGLNNKEKISKHDLKTLEELENFGIIKNNQVDFDYYKSKKNKPKM